MRRLPRPAAPGLPTRHARRAAIGAAAATAAFVSRAALGMFPLGPDAWPAAKVAGEASARRFEPPFARPAPQRLQLPDPLLEAFGFDRFATPGLERPPPGSAFLEGRYGLGGWTSLPALSLAAPDLPPATLPLALEAGPPEDLRRSLAWLLFGHATTAKPCLTRPIAFVRYGAESDSFSLLRCDGSLAAEAVDRLSLIARPPNVERPPLPLPDDPSPEAAAGEWVPHVRLLNPRLAWAVQKVADAFPWRTMYVMSGYRPGGHAGLHGQGRALDLFLMGVPNERLYRLCRTLADAGCGYYPHNKFVHLDVRPPGTGRAYWIDTSGPGEPSSYVDAWPGVEQGGAFAWRGAVE